MSIYKSEKELKQEVLRLMLKDYSASKIADELRLMKHQVLLIQQQIIDGYESQTKRANVAMIRMIEDELFAKLEMLNPAVVDVELNKEINELTYKYSTLCI
jgi:hypothetical protein